MPSLKDIPRADRIGPQHRPDHAGDGDGLAASRMGCAQDSIFAAGPVYSDEMRAVLSWVSAVVGEEVDPLLARRSVRAGRR